MLTCFKDYYLINYTLFYYVLITVMADWGTWSRPIKFITKNLLYLDIQYAGEGYVDINWKRSANKKINSIDQSQVLYHSNSIDNEHFEISACYYHPVTNEFSEQKYYTDGYTHRVDQLPLDTLINLKVRMWDSRGVWGQWSLEKSCLTLCPMVNTVTCVKECHATIHWHRMSSNTLPKLTHNEKIKLTETIHDVNRYYLRIEKMNDMVIDISSNTTYIDEESNKWSLLEEIQLTYDIFKLTVDTLTPNTLYRTTIKSVTVEGYEGIWSAYNYIYTLPKITIYPVFIGECSARIRWERPPPPLFKPDTLSIAYGQEYPKGYLLEVWSTEVEYTQSITFIDQETKADYEIKLDKTKLQKTKLEELREGCAYRARVQVLYFDSLPNSLWSETFVFVTPLPYYIILKQITEASCLFAWKRPDVVVEDHPEFEQSWYIPPDIAPEYQIQVLNASNHVLLSTVLTDNIHTYRVENLLHNTFYQLKVRSYDFDEYSRWSNAQTIVTSNLIELSTLFIGETYVCVKWSRDRPNISQLMYLQNPSDTDNISPNKSVFNPDVYIPESYVFDIKSNSNSALKFSINEVPIDAFLFRISNLQPNTPFLIRIRAQYSGNYAGNWSNDIAFNTLNLISSIVKAYGENYFISECIADKHTSQEVMEKLCHYEVLVQNWKLEEETNQSVDAENYEVNITQASSLFRIKNLLPSQTYRVFYRIWYESHFDVDTGLTLDYMSKDASDMDLQCAHTFDLEPDSAFKLFKLLPGPWSVPTFIHTLPPMQIYSTSSQVNSIDFRWERTCNFEIAKQAFGKSAIDGYQIRIVELQPTGANEGTNQLESPRYDGWTATLIDESLYPSDQDNHRIDTLRPDTLYGLEVRCSADSVWGLWSQLHVVATLPQLEITPYDIGEDYVSLRWERPRSQVPKDTPFPYKLLAPDEIDLYQYKLEILGIDNSFKLVKTFQSIRKAYKGTKLSASNLYMARITSCDKHNRWSVFSAPVYFASVMPLQLHINKISEQFADISWSRMRQPIDEYNEQLHGDYVHTQDPNVLEYHLCVFPCTDSPTNAIVDKRISSSAFTYHIDLLEPDCTYIAIIRAYYSDITYGLWSDEILINTLRLPKLKLISANNSYVLIGWSPFFNEETHIDAFRPDPNISAVAIKYRFHVQHKEATFQLEFKKESCITLEDGSIAYKITNLSDNSFVSVTTQIYYEEGYWGNFSTLFETSTTPHLNIIVDSKFITSREIPISWTYLCTKDSLLDHQLPNDSIYEILVCLINDNEPEVKSTQNITSKPKTNKKEPLEPASPVYKDINVNSLLLQPDSQFHVTTTSKYCVSGLSPSTRYFIFVRMLDKYSEYSYWCRAMVETYPLPPTNLSIAHKNGFLYLTWTPPDASENYTYSVERSLTEQEAMQGKGHTNTTAPGHVSWKPTLTVNCCSCKVATSKFITMFTHFRIRCSKVHNTPPLWSEYSSCVSYTTNNEQMFKLRLVALSRDSASLQWSPPEQLSEVQKRIQFKTKSIGPTTKSITPRIKSTTSPTKSTIPRTKSTIPRTKSIIATTKNTTPRTKQSTPSRGKKSVTPSIIVYKIMMGTDPDTLLEVQSSPSTNCQLTGLSPSTTYIIEIHGYIKNELTYTSKPIILKTKEPDDDTFTTFEVDPKVVLATKKVPRREGQKQNPLKRLKSQKIKA